MMMSSSSIMLDRPQMHSPSPQYEPSKSKVTTVSSRWKVLLVPCASSTRGNKCTRGIALGPCSGLPSILGRGRLHRPLFALCYAEGIQDSLQSTVVYAALVGEFFGGWVLVS